MSVFVQAGKLRHRITLQVDGGTAFGGYGTETNVWRTYAENVPAQIGPNGGSKSVIGAQISPESTHVVTIRYMPGILRSMRVLFGTRTFDINAIVDRAEENVVLDLYCKELPELPRA